MKELYSRTIELEDEGEETVVQVSEFTKGKLLVRLVYPENDGSFQHKETLFTEGEIFAVSSLLNDWTKKRAH